MKGMATPKSRFASGGATCKLGVLCYYSSSMLVDSFVLQTESQRSQTRPKAKPKKVWQYCKEKGT
ncbi:MAG: hypothetical protein BWX63_02204 [Bacteroidetes bacterium ADurb.Bin041]|jgi:hypothetical protein|nr:MAG: hypothetical protein BWX63_02204 [Bacteroidetes bacterium ADurb.Bin041]